jgi:hypothetical protein
VIIDFSGYAPGDELVLRNTAKAPFPNGEAADPRTVGQIMLFRVVESTGPDLSVIPAQLTTVNRLSNPSLTRVMTLNEQMGEDGPIGAFLNGMSFHDAPATEYPTLGATEMWEVVNMTGDAHPIHLHLVQFQLLNRQRVNVPRYERAFMEANPVMPAESYVPVPVEPYLRGKPKPADPNERGWKDTFRMNPGEVTRVLVRFAPQDESPAFSFDATAEPGYVWHCHILEHEENDMMRPYHLVAAAPVAPAGTVRIAPGGSAPASDVETGAPGIALRAPYPNPMTAGGTLRFQLGNAGPVEIDLFTVEGRLVSRLAGGWFAAGEHTVPFPGIGAPARGPAAGMYIVRLRAEGVERTQKLILAP